MSRPLDGHVVQPALDVELAERPVPDLVEGIVPAPWLQQLDSVLRDVARESSGDQDGRASDRQTDRQVNPSVPSRPAVRYFWFF